MNKKTVKTIMVALILMVLAIYFIAGTYAKYTTDFSGKTSIGVAKWNVKLTKDNFTDFIDLHTREDKTPIELSGGAVIGEKLAGLLGVGIGDEVYFGESSVPVNVDAICENYTFNYAYMTRETYAS